MSRAPTGAKPLHSLTDAELAEWDALSESTDAGYFTGPGWAMSWYDTFARGSECMVATWSDNSGVTAIAPMVRFAEPLLPGTVGGGPGVKAWRNIGSGIGGADHVGFACCDSYRDDVLEWVFAQRGSVNLASLSSDWIEPLRRRGTRVSDTTNTYAVDISGGSRPGSKKLWKHIIRSRRHLSDEGVEFDHVAGNSISGEDLRALFSLHGERSDRVGRRTTFTASRARFHELLVARSTGVHFPYLVRARVGERLVGALYGFAGPRRLSYYQSGWEPSYERRSLGSVLIGDAIDLALARGVSTFDFLRGDEPYKLRFGAEVIQDVSVFVPRGATGLVLRARAAGVELVARGRTGAVGG